MASESRNDWEERQRLLGTDSDSYMVSSDQIRGYDNQEYVDYKRRWYMLAVVCLLNLSNAMVSCLVEFRDWQPHVTVLRRTAVLHPLTMLTGFGGAAIRQECPSSPPLPNSGQTSSLYYTYSRLCSSGDRGPSWLSLHQFMGLFTKWTIHP